MPVAMVSSPRYPSIRVETESKNPLALVAAVREALRLAHVQRSEISRFSDEALASPGSSEVQEVCRKWVRVESEEPS